MAAQHESDRRMLPQGMAQGNEFALIDKPRTEFVVVLFGHKVGDFLAHRAKCKEIGDTILNVFNPEPKTEPDTAEEAAS